MCFFKGLFLYFLEHLNNDSEKCLPIFARNFRKVHVNLSFHPSVLQGSRFVWSLALPVIVIAPFSVFQKWIGTLIYSFITSVDEVSLKFLERSHIYNVCSLQPCSIVPIFVPLWIRGRPLEIPGGGWKFFGAWICFCKLNVYRIFFHGMGFAQFILFYYFFFNLSSFVTHRQINVRFYISNILFH